MVRYKRRYVVCEFKESAEQAKKKTAKSRLTERDIYHALADMIQRLHGDYGLSAVQSQLKVKYVNTETGTVMIRVSRDQIKIVTSSLPLVKEVKNRPMIVTTLHVAGTMRSCYKKVAKNNETQIHRVSDKLKEVGSKKEVMKMMGKVSQLQKKTIRTTYPDS